MIFIFLKEGQAKTEGVGLIEENSEHQNNRDPKGAGLATSRLLKVLKAFYNRLILHDFFIL